MANPFSFDLDRLDADGIIEARERNKDRTKTRMQDIHALIVNRRLDKQFANNPTSSEAFLAKSQAFQGYDPTRAQQNLALGIDAKKEENRALEAKLAREQALALARAKGKGFESKALTKGQQNANAGYLQTNWQKFVKQPGVWDKILSILPGVDKNNIEGLLTPTVYRQFNGHFQDVIRESDRKLNDEDARNLAFERLLGNISANTFGSESATTEVQESDSDDAEFSAINQTAVNNTVGDKKRVEMTQEAAEAIAEDLGVSVDFVNLQYEQGNEGIIKQYEALRSNKFWADAFREKRDQLTSDKKLWDRRNTPEYINYLKLAMREHPGVGGKPSPATKKYYLSLINAAAE